MEKYCISYEKKILLTKIQVLEKLINKLMVSSNCAIYGKKIDFLEISRSAQF